MIDDHFISQIKYLYTLQFRDLEEIEQDIKSLERRKVDKFVDKHKALEGISETEKLLAQYGIEPRELFNIDEKGRILWRE